MKMIINTKSFIIILVATLLIISSTCLAAEYYVDASKGSDNYNGLSPDKAWQTIAKVNFSKFEPGDNILFKRGEIWREQLTIPSSGSLNSPITFSAYGHGNKPQIDIGSSQIQKNNCIQLYDKKYVTIENFTLLGGKFQSIRLWGLCSNVIIQNCDISYAFQGITADNQVTGNIQILNNHIHRTSEYAIIIYSPDKPSTSNLIMGNKIHSVHGGASTNECGIFASMNDSVITENEIFDVGSHDNTDHAIYLSGCNSVEISYNKIYRSHNVGIKLSNSRNIDVMYNLIYNNKEGVRIEVGLPQNIRIFNIFNISNSTLHGLNMFFNRFKYFGINFRSFILIITISFVIINIAS